MEYSIKEKETIDNSSIKKIFLNLAGQKINLSLAELSQIRNKLLNNYNKTDLEALVKKIEISEE